MDIYERIMLGVPLSYNIKTPGNGGVAPHIIDLVTR